MKIVMIGPVYPYTSGLSYYVSLLYRQLCKNHDVTLLSYSFQYPQFLYKRKQKDYEDPNNFSSTSIEVCPSLLPSAMFCFVLLAACTIWSTVLSPYFGRNR